jgi:hypothetical protein
MASGFPGRVLDTLDTEVTGCHCLIRFILVVPHYK